MGLEKSEWTSEGEVQTIMGVIADIPRKFWEDETDHILTHPKTPEHIKTDISVIIEVANLVYEENYSEAEERLYKLTEPQRSLLLFLMGVINGNDPQCNCENCVREREEESERGSLENSLKIDFASYRERLEEISRSKTYQVSEDRYEELIEDRVRLTQLISKLETTVELLENDDPRHIAAAEILDDYFDRIY